MFVDKRIVLQYEHGRFTFRRIAPNASVSGLVELAKALNAFQTDPVKRVLLVASRDF